MACPAASGVGAVRTRSRRAAGSTTISAGRCERRRERRRACRPRPDEGRASPAAVGVAESIAAQLEPGGAAVAARRRRPRRRCAAGQGQVAAVLPTEAELAGGVAEDLVLDEGVAELARGGGADAELAARVGDRVERREQAASAGCATLPGQPLPLPREPHAAGARAIGGAGARREVASWSKWLLRRTAEPSSEGSSGVPPSVKYE